MSADQATTLVAATEAVVKARMAHAVAVKEVASAERRATRKAAELVDAEAAYTKAAAAIPAGGLPAKTK